MPVQVPAEKRDSQLMRDMFHTVAPRYDFITRAFSYGMDRHWKRTGVERARLPQNPVVLDLASGTGDFSALIRRQYPGARAVTADITERMLTLARARGAQHPVCADACALPFATASFDCVFVGYGLRNFGNLPLSLREIERVTRPGGLLVSLDFFLPRNQLLRRLYLAYLYAQGGFWGLVLHGRPRVYTYIPDSLRCFVSIDGFSSMLRRAGYGRVEARSYILGGIGLHWAAKSGTAGGNSTARECHMADSAATKGDEDGPVSGHGFSRAVAPPTGSGFSPCASSTERQSQKSENAE